MTNKNYNINKESLKIFLDIQEKIINLTDDIATLVDKHDIIVPELTIEFKGIKITLNAKKITKNEKI